MINVLLMNIIFPVYRISHTITNIKYYYLNILPLLILGEHFVQCLGHILGQLEGGKFESTITGSGRVYADQIFNNLNDKKYFDKLMKTFRYCKQGSDCFYSFLYWVGRTANTLCYKVAMWKKSLFYYILFITS